MQIPVNCPYAPVRNHQRDGLMNVNQDPSPINYEPNSIDGTPKEAPQYKDSVVQVQGQIGRERIEKTDDFTQAGELYRKYSDEEKNNLIANIVNDLSQTPDQTQLRAICNFFRADAEYGMRVAQGLGVDISGFIPSGK
ncbi:Vegetative catalase [compost metagenome]